MINSGVVTVTKVLINQDLRRLFSMIDRTRCKPNQCWVFVNRARVLAYIVFGNGIVARYDHHMYYPGEKISVEAIAEALGELTIDLEYLEVHEKTIDWGSRRRFKKAA